MCLSICVRKKEYVQPDGISITFMKEDIGEMKETFTFSAIWSYKQGKGVPVLPSRKTMYMVLLLLCGDIQSCPGPLQEQLDRFMKSRGIKMFHHNIRGLLTNFIGLQELFDRHKNIDIMTISETHIIDEQYYDNDNLYKIPGYTFLKWNRKAGRGGGVAMFIGESVMWERRQDLEKDNIESIWIEVFIQNSKSFLVAAYYRPPEGSAYLPKNFNDMLRDSIKESKEIIILGDFNVNYLKANEHKDFKALFRLYGFSQMILKKILYSD